MSHVIEFLERLGQDAHLRHAPTEAVAQALLQAGIEEPLRAAILGEDRHGLEVLMGARSKMYCGVYAPEEEKEVPEKKVPQKEDEEKEDEKEDESEDDKESQ